MGIGDRSLVFLLDSGRAKILVEELVIRKVSTFADLLSDQMLPTRFIIIHSAVCFQISSTIASVTKHRYVYSSGRTGT